MANVSRRCGPTVDGMGDTTNRPDDTATNDPQTRVAELEAPSSEQVAR